TQPKCAAPNSNGRTIAHMGHEVADLRRLGLLADTKMRQSQPRCLDGPVGKDDRSTGSEAKCFWISAYLQVKRCCLLLVVQGQADDFRARKQHQTSIRWFIPAIIYILVDGIDEKSNAAVLVEG